MHGGVAAGSPAGAGLQQQRMICAANIDMAGGHGRALHLRMAAQAQIGITDGEEILIHGTVWIMAHSTAFTHGRMFKNEGACLFAMALRAAFAGTGHGEAAGGFENIAPVRVMALVAVHVPLDDRVMMRQVELGINIQMTLKTRSRIVPGIDDETRVAAGFNVFAARAVTGFAAGLAG